jgi:hypothetical protein
MKEKPHGLNDEDRLKAENDFLKMKLMLENGAQFSEGNNNDLPPEIENQFLRNMVEFESQFAEHKTIKVFDKIGKPAQFVNVADIPDEKMDKAWEELSKYLQQHGIFLDVCSPNISKKELYRFTTEELFVYEMDDISIPGMMHGFIYDEFHPDFKYDNSRLAIQDCISRILTKEPFEWAHHFREVNLQLNQHSGLDLQQFKERVNQFKSSYDDLQLEEPTAQNCIIEEKLCKVSGDYSVKASVGMESFSLSGTWEVLLEQDENEYWYIVSVQVPNIKF